MHNRICEHIDLMGGGYHDGNEILDCPMFYRSARIDRPSDQSIKGADVVDILNRLKYEESEMPNRIQVDNGSEFISKNLDHWAFANNVTLDYSRPGKPTDNPFIESFNGSYRDECLNTNWFLSLPDAKQKIEQWRRDYNGFRPHCSLNDLTPNEVHSEQTASPISLLLTGT